MNIFQEKTVRDAMLHPGFTDCIKAIHTLLKAAEKHAFTFIVLGTVDKLYADKNF